MRCSCVERPISTSTMNDCRTKHRRLRLSLSFWLLYVCAAVLVDSAPSSAVLQRRDDECMLEMCSSWSVLSDRCAAECERLTGTADEPSSLPTVSRRAPSSFVRIGRSGVADGVVKRYSSFVRIGRPAVPGNKRYSSFVRIGRAGARATRNREAPYYRRAYDLSVPPLDKRRYSSFVRIGRNADVPSSR